MSPCSLPLIAWCLCASFGLLSAQVAEPPQAKPLPDKSNRNTAQSFSYNIAAEPAQSARTAAKGENGQNMVRAMELFMAPTKSSLTLRAQLQIRLKSYHNEGRMMRNKTTCTCPAVEGSQMCRKNVEPCYQQFTVVVGAANQMVQLRSLPFEVVYKSESLSASANPDWGVEMLFLLPQKPQLFDIYAVNLGPVYSKSPEGVISYEDILWPVDAWSLELGGSWEASSLIKGQYASSSLHLDYSVQCLNGFMGPTCELRCKGSLDRSANNSQQLEGGANNLFDPKSNANQLQTICRSDLEEDRFFECTYTDSHRSQVRDCKFCTYGLIDQSVCALSADQWKSGNGTTAGPHGVYKTLSIVFGVAFAVTLLLLLVMCVFCWFCLRQSEAPRKQKRRTTDEQQPSAGSATYRRGIGAPFSTNENGFASDSRDWATPTQPPASLRAGIYPQRPAMGSAVRTAASVGAGGRSPLQQQMDESSPNTSESEYRPSPFTPRREAQV